MPSVFPENNYVIDYIKLLEGTPTHNLDFGSVVFSRSENHNTMQIQSFYKGLRYIFDGYKVEQDVNFHPAEKLKEQFNNLGYEPIENNL